MNRNDVAKLLAYRNILDDYANGSPIEVLSEEGRWYESEHIPVNFNGIRIKGRPRILPINHSEALNIMMNKMPIFKDYNQYVITAVNPMDVTIQEQIIGFVTPKEYRKTFDELSREFTFENGNPVGVW